MTPDMPDYLLELLNIRYTETIHTHLAMVAHCLRAVVPKGLLGLDLEGEDILGLALHGSKVEAGEDAAAAGEGLTGLVERGLHNCVVLIGLDQLLSPCTNKPLSVLTLGR
jgi:hypothetical protein